MRPGPAACVFCAQPIGSGEEVTGRPPHAAHARCADAALADDRHWDAVAAASGDVEASEPQPAPRGASKPGEPGAGRAGCLGVIGGVMLAAAAVVRSARWTLS
jgi:hypothetical protein